MYDQILERFKEELSQSSPHTVAARSYYAKVFLDFAGDRPLSEWNKGLVNEFLDALRKGYPPGTKPLAPGTIRTVYGIVKRVFDAAKAVHEAEKVRAYSAVNPEDPAAVAEILKVMQIPGPTWDVGKRSAPRVEAEDVVKPAATIEEIEAMVKASKEGVLTPAETAYLALSTVYGLRREELCRVSREHLDFGEGTIYVMTAKGGERRKQLLCEEVVPIFKEYSFDEEYSLFQMSAMWWRICARAGLEPKDGSGWHSPRRYLDTALVSIFGELVAHIFLRWKLSSSSLMVERYYSEDPLEVDRRVLTTGHPVVPLWR